MTHTKTRAEQRIEQLVNAGRPLTPEESDELYRALHADYMRKWRTERAKIAARHMRRFVTGECRKEEIRLLGQVMLEREG